VSFFNNGNDIAPFLLPGRKRNERPKEKGLRQGVNSAAELRGLRTERPKDVLLGESLGTELSEF
jgi:hypothetical protein